MHFYSVSKIITQFPIFIAMFLYVHYRSVSENFYQNSTWLNRLIFQKFYQSTEIHFKNVNFRPHRRSCLQFRLAKKTWKARRSSAERNLGSKYHRRGPFIKNIINQGGGGLPKDDITNKAYLVMTKWEGGKKSHEIDDVFYEGPLVQNWH